MLHDGVFVPAPGQGVIAVQARTGSPSAEAAARADHASTHAALDAERHVVRALEATCHTPVGVLSSGGVVRGFVGLPDGSSHLPRRGPDRRRARVPPARRGRRRPSARGGTGHVTVYLVGAGPGDPGLLTVRARELIDAADVILYDRLIPPGVLDGVDAELVYVGKQGGGPQMPQEEIDRLLVQYGTGGRSVVRLKGGDPFVFGRGGEEALVLRDAGIPYEVVPGVTAGIAAPAYAGVPVTHRELASGVAFVTGHENPDKPETALDWPALAAFPGTLVFYMGVKALPRIASQLIAGGRPSSEPVAVVERGTLPGQKTVLSTLGEIGSVQGIRAPAITLVGPVAALREQLAWLETRPLYGRTVAVTRARAQASALAVRLRGLGAEVVEAPAIRTQPLPVELPDVASYDLLCVTSPTGADQLFTHLRDARDLAGVTVAAIGPGTARALRAHGVEADIVPERAVAEGLVEALARRDPAAARASLARPAQPRVGTS